MEMIKLSDDTVSTAVARARAVLEEGGIVVFPTDTLYGLAVDAHDEAAIARLRALKGRPDNKPVSIIVSSIDAIQEYAVLDGEAKRIAEEFLPGALTLVLPALPHVPKDILLNGEVGIRVPAHFFSLSLATSFGRAYTATSANKTGEKNVSRVEELTEQFGPLTSEIDLVIDAGELSAGVPSTVIDFTDGVPVILREGKITREELGI